MKLIPETTALGEEFEMKTYKYYTSFGQVEVKNPSS